MSPGISAVDVALVAVAHQRPARARMVEPDGMADLVRQHRAEVERARRRRPRAAVQASSGLKQIVARVSGAMPRPRRRRARRWRRRCAPASPWAPIRMSGVSPGAAGRKRGRPRGSRSRRRRGDLPRAGPGSPPQAGASSAIGASARQLIASGKRRRRWRSRSSPPPLRDRRRAPFHLSPSICSSRYSSAHPGLRERQAGRQAAAVGRASTGSGAPGRVAPEIVATNRPPAR